MAIGRALGQLRFQTYTQIAAVKTFIGALEYVLSPELL